jgi:hypothetical protein
MNKTWPIGKERNLNSIGFMKQSGFRELQVHPRRKLVRIGFITAILSGIEVSRV